MGLKACTWLVVWLLVLMLLLIVAVLLLLLLLVVVVVVVVVVAVYPHRLVMVRVLSPADQCLLLALRVLLLLPDVNGRLALLDGRAATHLVETVRKQCVEHGQRRACRACQATGEFEFYALDTGWTRRRLQ